MQHRIRQVFVVRPARFEGPLEVDEAYIGGKEHNKHAGKRLRAAGWAAGKIPVVGLKDRATNRVSA
ncbi:MAG: transposase [Gemmatimonadota bacterium]|nr:transposase [Gemmatimonadota bacterium]